MKQRGRKSANALSLVDNSKILEIPRAKPPEELNDEEAQEWKAIVNRLPADYFGREHYATLVQLCRHTVAARRIAQLIEASIAADDLHVAGYLKLLRAQELESRAITALSRTMRLTHQANVPTNSARIEPVTVENPWTD